MKTCPKCKKEKELDEFRINRKRKSGYQQYCIPCDKEYQKEWYKKNAESAKKRTKVNNIKTDLRNQKYIIDYLNSHPCIICGEKDIVVLEFDHLGDKDCEVSRIMNGSLERLKKEVAKCQVLCANCHKRKTAKDYNWYKLISPDT